jgi:3-deoxy-D-manno-octulosonic-acid transferase
VISDRRRIWTFRIYNALVLLLLPLVLLYVAIRWRRRIAKGLDRWDERWGRLTPAQQASFRQGKWWWVHAVSVGEVKAIEAFLRKVPALAGVRVVLTVVTPEAIAYAAQKKLAEIVIAAPIDLPWIVRRTVRAIQPKLFISVESEFWPNLLRENHRAGARVVLINGRLSARSFRSYRRFQGVLQVLWECFDLWAVREVQDAERFRALGVPEGKIKTTGNLKYDLLDQTPESRLPAGAGKPTLVIGSTREGEEKILLPILERLCASHPGLRVIWAPRHMERVAEVETLLQSGNVSCLRKSSMPLNGRFDRSPASHILWDSMGDLLEAYRRADIAIVGGSFVHKGGQNPIEPAALGLPVVFGPSMENFLAISETLITDGGARQVTLERLEECLSTLIIDAGLRQSMGRNARDTVERQKGATERTIHLLKGLESA